MPVQLKRLLLLGIILIGIFILIRKLLVPDSFGEYGHYRGKALVENQVYEIKYMGNQSCGECHDSILTMKNEGYHDVLKCEVCHGPGYLHNLNPKVNKLHKPIERAECAKCHSKNKARPEAAITQQDIVNHHPESKCIKCHNPHQP